jgi:MFS family permease
MEEPPHEHLDSDKEARDDEAPCPRVADPESGGSPSTPEAEETYPEGGTEAWLVVLGSWLALFSSLGLMNILATFQTYVSTHQLIYYDEATIGWIFSLYTFICFFLGIYIGPVFDKYGPRWLILGGTVCLATSLMLLSVSSGESTWRLCSTLLSR